MNCWDISHFSVLKKSGLLIHKNIYYLAWHHLTMEGAFTCLFPFLLSMNLLPFKIFIVLPNMSFFLKILFIYLFLDREEGRKKERERNINVWLPRRCPLLGTWPTTQACALTRNRTGDPLVHRLALNPLSHTSQGPTCLFFFFFFF